ncbi:BA14K family protein [Rhizobium sp. Root482]|jgi:hypothetical protein|uniref:BA14K family protein n=1 Tax=Rhizobium sp. Root482 TaxID=1736543 RepID=UPI0006FBE283|nr:BA14K family protein [Rhizobium sp. Root482]KQY15391.1 hypothetical protein ASD31_08445 [Rhizobium sp. Root482]
MNKVIKAAVLALATAAVVIPTVTPAQADHRRGHRDYYRHHGHYNGGDAAALGALGLATGVIIGGAIASQPRYQERVYIDPEPEYYRPRPVYRRPVVVQNYGSLEPWSPAWYRYCEQRYRSFEPRSGTFTGYDGQQHFCNAG